MIQVKVIQTQNYSQTHNSQIVQAFNRIHKLCGVPEPIKF